MLQKWTDSEPAKFPLCALWLCYLENIQNVKVWKFFMSLLNTLKTNQLILISPAEVGTFLTF